MSSHRAIAVLASGGLDSAVLLAHSLKQFESVQPLYLQCGYVWERAELFWLKRFLKTLRHGRLKPLACLPLPIRDLYRSHWSVTGKNTPGAKATGQAVSLPGKNILLAAYGSLFCALHNISHLAIGPLKTNPFPDANRAFFNAMAQACSRGLDHKIRIYAPFLTHTKDEVMQLGRMLPLELTFSCLNPKGYRHCGVCNKCAERQQAWRDSRRIARTQYAS